MKPVKPPRINGRVPVLSAQEAVNYIPDGARRSGEMGIMRALGTIAAYF